MSHDPTSWLGAKLYHTYGSIPGVWGHADEIFFFP
jgi:hypothetical protein